MKFTVLLFLILTSCISFKPSAFAGDLSESVSADFLNHLEPLENTKFITTPDDDHSQIMAAFDQAKVSIKVGIFGISGKHIADSLEAAQKRGVSVTIICDQYCVSTDKRSALVTQLKTAGVTIHMASPGFTISHWKMFVIDDSKVFISTMNFITRFKQMRDMGVFVTNPGIVKEVLSVFNADIQNAKNQTALTPTLSQPNLVWSPINSEEKIVRLILSAKNSIDIWIENMGDAAIHQALRTAVQNKVQVRVMTSLCGLGSDPVFAFSHLKQLISYGVRVQVMPYPASPEAPYVHAKVVVADKTIFFGSENFSMNSLLKARELGIIFANTEIQNRIHTLFESDWSHTISLPASPPEKCEALQP